MLAGLRHTLPRGAATAKLHAACSMVTLDTNQPKIFAFVRQASTGALVCVIKHDEFWIMPGGWTLARGACAFYYAVIDARPMSLDPVHILLSSYARLWQ